MDSNVELAVETFQRIISLGKSMEFATSRLQRELASLDDEQFTKYVIRTEKLRTEY